MRVAYHAKAVQPWHNGVLMYNEAIRQGKEAVMIPQNHMHDELNAALRRFKPDWTLITGSRKMMKYYETAKNYGKVCVWCPDAVDDQRMELWKRLIGKIDLAIVTVSGLADRLNEMGIKAVWLPQFYSSRTIVPTVDRLSGDVVDLCFFGGIGDGRRTEWLKKLRRMYRCRFAGASNPPSAIQGSQLANFYRNSKIAIGIKRSHPFHDLGFQASDRMFKAMGCGCMFLTYDMPGLDRIFDHGGHLSTYFDDDFDDLVHNIRILLDKSVRREEIALAGQKEVMEKHTLEVRLGQYYEAMAAA